MYYAPYDVVCIVVKIYEIAKVNVTEIFPVLMDWLEFKFKSHSNYYNCRCG